MNPQQEDSSSGKVLQNILRIIGADIFFPWVGQVPHFSDFSVHFAWTLIARASAECAYGLAELFMEGKSELSPCKTSWPDLSGRRLACVVKKQRWHQVTKAGQLMQKEWNMKKPSH